MKVILLKSISGVGEKYDIKEVNAGHAMNFLLPKKLALIATPSALKQIEKSKAEAEFNRKKEAEEILKSLKSIYDKSVVIKAKTNEAGHLFSAIHKKEILGALEKEFKVSLNENYLLLEKPIKEVGEFKLPISFAGQNFSLNLKIEGE